MRLPLNVIVAKIKRRVRSHSLGGCGGVDGGWEGASYLVSSRDDRTNRIRGFWEALSCGTARTVSSLFHAAHCVRLKRGSLARTLGVLCPA